MEIGHYLAAVAAYRSEFLETANPLIVNYNGMFTSAHYKKKILPPHAPAVRTSKINDNVAIAQNIKALHNATCSGLAPIPVGIEIKPNECKCGYFVFQFPATGCGGLSKKRMLIQRLTGYIVAFEISDKRWYIYSGQDGIVNDAIKAALEAATPDEEDKTKKGKGKSKDAVKDKNKYEVNTANFRYEEETKETIALKGMDNIIAKIFGIKNETKFEGYAHFLPLMIAEPARNEFLCRVITECFNSEVAFPAQLCVDFGQKWGAGYDAVLTKEQVDEILVRLWPVSKALQDKEVNLGIGE